MARLGRGYPRNQVIPSANVWTATVDPNGNVNSAAGTPATGTDTFIVDTQATATVDIKDSGSHDDMISTVDVLSATKLAGTIDAGGSITSLTVSDAAGHSIIVPAAAITLNADGSWSATVDVSGLNDGTLTTTLNAQDALGNTAPEKTDTIQKDTVTTVSLDPIADTNDSTPTFSGTGEAGSTITVKDGAEIKAGQTVANWDPHNHPIVSEVAGFIRFIDFVDGVTVIEKTDELTGLSSIVVLDVNERSSQGKELRPTVKLVDANGKDVMIPGTDVSAQYFLPGQAIVQLEDGAEVNVGDAVARIPQASGGTKDITGGLPRVADRKSVV